VSTETSVSSADAFFSRPSRERIDAPTPRERRADASRTPRRRALIRRENSSVRRVRDSLRFTLNDGEYRKTHEGLGEQIATSYVAGLTARPYWDVHGGDFPWMEFLQDHHAFVKEELFERLKDPKLESKGQNVWVAAARDDAAGYGPDWRTLVLQDRCEWEPTNVSLFPKTVELVKRSGAPSVEVFFAKQAPGTGIKPHTDFTNFIMTAHLGLDVPPPPRAG
jgi:aspartate beta-hydroxylase